jgi:hypothetical protein
VVGGDVTVSGSGTFNGGLILDGATSSYQGDNADQVDESNRTNTYITFKPAGSVNDFAYLRQIGGVNAQHIALQFHDNATDGRFSIGCIGSFANPDPPLTQLFELDGTSARFSVPVSISANAAIEGNVAATGSGTFNTGIYLDAGTSVFQGTTTVDESNRTNTFITFKHGNSTNDWAYLRDIGSENSMHLALQFHDDANDGRFSIGRIASSTQPQSSGDPPLSQLFELDGTSARFFVPVIPSSFTSGQIMKSIMNFGNNGFLITGQTITVGSLSSFTIPPYTGLANYIRIIISYSLVTATDRVCVDLSAHYQLSGGAQDELLLYVYDKEVGGTQQLIHTSFQYFNDQAGGGSRSSPLFPVFFIFTPSTSSLNREMEIRINNLSNDNLQMKSGLNFKITQVKN